MKLRNSAATARLTTSTIAYGAHDQLPVNVDPVST
jgi:hypothetical protein